MNLDIINIERNLIELGWYDICFSRYIRPEYYFITIWECTAKHILSNNAYKIRWDIKPFDIEIIEVFWNKGCDLTVSKSA